MICITSCTRYKQQRPRTQMKKGKHNQDNQRNKQKDKRWTKIYDNCQKQCYETEAYKGSGAILMSIKNKLFFSILFYIVGHPLAKRSFTTFWYWKQLTRNEINHISKSNVALAIYYEMGQDSRSYKLFWTQFLFNILTYVSMLNQSFI